MSGGRGKEEERGREENIKSASVQRDPYDAQPMNAIE
jgi:hypothetical protein